VCGNPAHYTAIRGPAREIDPSRAPVPLAVAHRSAFCRACIEPLDDRGALVALSVIRL
jgi:hypothetical protein